MHTSRWLQLALFAIAPCLTVGALSPTIAATFDSTEVNSDNFVAIAAPYGSNNHQLLILEQLSNRQACWRENGSNPGSVDPLLLNFDFTGICGRSTDSNGYSIRASGQDLGLEYILRVVERNGDLVLVGTHRRNRRMPEIEIGRTRGISTGNNKIFLNSGWRFTKRTYQGRALGHIYLTSDSVMPPVNAATNPALPQPIQPQPRPSQTTQPQPTAPIRELVFTKPQAEPTPSSREQSATRSQPLPPSPIPRSTTPQAEPAPVPVSGERRATSSQTLPPPPASGATIPTFVVPTN